MHTNELLMTGSKSFHYLPRPSTWIRVLHSQPVRRIIITVLTITKGILTASTRGYILQTHQAEVKARTLSGKERGLLQTCFDSAVLCLLLSPWRPVLQARDRVACHPGPQRALSVTWEVSWRACPDKEELGIEVSS